MFKSWPYVKVRFPPNIDDEAIVVEFDDETYD